MAKSILIFANSRFPQGAANSVNVFRMSAAFTSLGRKVTLYALRSTSPLKRKVWRETCRRYGYESKTRTRLLWWPFQRGAEPFLALVATVVLAFVPRRTLIYTRVRYVAAIASLWGFSTYFESHAPPLSRLQRQIDQRLLRSRQCRIIVISNGLKDAYRKLGLQPENTVLAPDSGRPNRLTPPGEHEFHGPVVDVGYVGSLLPGRGTEIILALAKRCPQRRFHIIGWCPDHVRTSNGCPDNVVFYDDVTPHQADRLPSLFDVLLMPYQKEVQIRNGLDTGAWMSPMKLFEFMLSGRPIVASRLPAICEILNDSVEAFLVDPSNEAGWNEALSKLDDPRIRWQLAFRAYEMARKKYTWEIRAKSILEVRENP